MDIGFGLRWVAMISGNVYKNSSGKFFSWGAGRKG